MESVTNKSTRQGCSSSQSVKNKKYKAGRPQESVMKTDEKAKWQQDQ